MGPIGWIREIVLDSIDPWDLARFWARLLGGDLLVEWYPGWVTLELPQGTCLRRGDSPAGAGPIVHFDVLVGDLAGADERVIASGGVFAGEHVSPRPGPGGELIPWPVYRDRSRPVFWPARAIASVVSLAAPIQSSSPMKRDAGYSRIAGW
jgi:Glyoxalase-like domain